MMSKTIPIYHNGLSYDITLVENNQISQKLKPLLEKKGRVFVVTDRNVKNHHLPDLLDALNGITQKPLTFILEAGEQSKSFAVFEKLLNDMIKAGIDRNSLIIALGGGVVGDVAGFAAATLLRGVDYIHIPTTLLAQIDSAIGGKTGINLASVKNMVGAFHQPLAVLLNPGFLASLPKRQKISGYAEMVKYGLIRDQDFFSQLEKNHADILEKTSLTDAQCEAIIRSCEIKAQIVSEDMKESGKRALLNLGHSFAHAIEAYMGYDGDILHGEAVAIGIVLAFQLAEKIFACPADDTQRVITHFRKTGLPVDFSDYNRLTKWNIHDMLSFMLYDKKNRDGRLTLILPKKIGEAHIYPPMEKEKFLVDMQPIFSKMIKAT